MNRTPPIDFARSGQAGRGASARQVAPPPFVLDNVPGPLPTMGTLEVLRKLVGFNTESSESNLELIFWCREYLQAHGVPCRLSFDSQGRKANLFASVGSGRLPGLMLAAHTDVVPVSGQSWTSDPFVAVQRHGRIYGRGVADAKGFIAACLSMVPQIIDAGLERPIHIALTYDEETTMDGVKRLLVDLRDVTSPMPQGCLLGCPTEMQPVVGHKGRAHWVCRVRGKDAHSALVPRAMNAIENAAVIVLEIQAMAARRLEREEPDRTYDVHHSTVQTGMIRGGLSANTVPSLCEFDVEMRHLPRTDVEQFEAELRQFLETEMLPRMRAQHPDAAVEWLRRSYLPPFEFAGESAQGNGRVAALLRRLARASTQRPRYVSFGTEAGWYQRDGIPTVMIGPGSISLAHRPDEYVEMSQLAQCEALIARVVSDLLPEERNG